LNFPNTKSNFARKALLYLGCGSDISPVLSSQVFPLGREDEAPMVLLCDPGDNARSFYKRLSEVRKLESDEYLKVRGHKPFESDMPPFSLQVVQQPHAFTDKEREYAGLPSKDDSPKSSAAGSTDLGWDWMEIEVSVEGRGLRRYRFLPHPHHVVLELLKYWRMELSSLVIIRLASMFDKNGDEMSTGDWVERNGDWIQQLDTVWTDNPGPWTKRGWIPSLRMLQQLSPMERTSADRPVWCLNTPVSAKREPAEYVLGMGTFNEPLSNYTKADQDNHWADPGKWLFVTRSPERFYRGSSSAYKLLLELPKGIDYVIDTQTMNSQLYKIQHGIELKKQQPSDQKTIYTLIELLQSGHGVAVRVRDIDEAVDVIEQAYRLERIPSPGREVIMAKLR